MGMLGRVAQHSNLKSTCQPPVGSNISMLQDHGTSARSKLLSGTNSPQSALMVVGITWFNKGLSRAIERRSRDPRKAPAVQFTTYSETYNRAFISKAGKEHIVQIKCIYD
ncbi:hypothetical protein J1614_000358 [Plenodomus biglobosus]|nr:hypothetical protein J1614_000358 [Plenodomus biglobosus]